MRHAIQFEMGLKYIHTYTGDTRSMCMVVSWPYMSHYLHAIWGCIAYLKIFYENIIAYNVLRDVRLKIHIHKDTIRLSPACRRDTNCAN